MRQGGFLGRGARPHVLNNFEAFTAYIRVLSLLVHKAGIVGYLYMCLVKFAAEVIIDEHVC
jgi:hypothetical protein